MVPAEEYDIAVVGGGIAGLYCCLHAPPGASVALFEATDRFGGKLETTNMAGFQAEWGSMRFAPERQHTMRDLIRDLGIETEPFPEYSSPPPDERTPLFGPPNDRRRLNALDLFAEGIARALGRSVADMMAMTEEELEDVRRRGTYRNTFLWQQAIWNVLTDMLGYDAVRYIMTEGSFFHGLHENPGMAGTGITWVKMLQMSKYLRGVKGGMQLITDGMLARTKGKGVAVHPLHTLQGLSAASGGRGVALLFDRAAVRARHVILALPSSALKLIKGIPTDIRTLLDSVIEYPLVKCFFVVKDRWWDEDVPQQDVRSFPARELHYHSKGSTGNIMVYADRPYSSFWSRYVVRDRHDRAEMDANADLARAFAGIAKISPDRIMTCGVRDWTRPPYGSGVHLWKAGVETWKVGERLAAFSLLPGAPANIHICGEAFSDYQGFMEGAMRSARNALAKALA